MDDEKSQVRRRQVRIQIKDGVKAAVSIYTISGEAAASRAIPVLLLNISTEGLTFLTHLRFPVSKDYLLQINVTFNDWHFCLNGYVTWRRREENQYEYGITLLPDSQISQALSAALLYKLRFMHPNQTRIHHIYEKLLAKSESQLRN